MWEVPGTHDFGTAVRVHSIHILAEKSQDHSFSSRDRKEAKSEERMGAGLEACSYLSPRSPREL